MERTSESTDARACLKKWLQYYPSFKKGILQNCFVYCDVNCGHDSKYQTSRIQKDRASGHFKEMDASMRRTQFFWGVWSIVNRDCHNVLYSQTEWIVKQTVETWIFVTRWKTMNSVKFILKYFIYWHTHKCFVL